MSDFEVWSPMPGSAAIFCPWGLRATPPPPPGWTPAGLGALQAARPSLQAALGGAATSPHAGGPTPPGVARRPA
jgi:hypothetical protein